MDQHETQIDVSWDGAPYIRDRSRPFDVAGTLVEVTIPFCGDSGAFNIKPSARSLSPPRGQVQNDTLLITIEGTDLKPEPVRSEIDKTLEEIERHLVYLRSDAYSFNENILQLANKRIISRRQKLLVDQNLVANLGFPLKNRDGTSETFTTPTVRKRIVQTLPKASVVPYKL